MQRAPLGGRFARLAPSALLRKMMSIYKNRANGPGAKERPSEKDRHASIRNVLETHRAVPRTICASTLDNKSEYDHRPTPTPLDTRNARKADGFP